MTNPVQRILSVDCSLSRLVIALLAAGVLLVIVPGCGDTVPIPDNQMITEGTATPKPALIPEGPPTTTPTTPTTPPITTPATPPTTTPTTPPTPGASSTPGSSKADELALDRAVEDNTSLKKELSALHSVLTGLRTTVTPMYVLKEWLDAQREGAAGQKAPTDTHSQFIRDEIDRLKAEAERLKESGLDYDYAFPESGFPMERKKDVLALAVHLRESVVQVRTDGGMGTGFVIGDDLVVTNDHVVSGDQSIVIVTLAGEDFDAEIVGSDPTWDIALLRSARPLGTPALAWGDSRNLNLKDGLFSIGHPGQMGTWALTAGVFVRSKTNPLPSANLKDEDFQREGHPGTVTKVQSTIPGQPGTSGSPVFNMNGEVISVTYGTVSLEVNSRELGEAFSDPVPHRIHSVPMMVSREWTSGSPAWKAQELIEEWLTAKS